LIIGSWPPAAANINAKSAYSQDDFGPETKNRREPEENVLQHKTTLPKVPLRRASLSTGLTRGVKLGRGAGGRKNDVALPEGHRPYPRAKPIYAYRVEVVELVIPD
jgi:hypothetical protein